MNIETESKRLILRPLNLNDANFIIELVNSDGWLRFIGDRNVKSHKDAENYILNILESEDTYYTVFELKKTTKAIGIVTFMKREEEEFPDIGFALLPKYERNGYTLEACGAYLKKIKSETPNTIIAFTSPENEKSIKLLTSLGLTYVDDRKKGNEMLSYYSLNAENS